jgi:hypothetical protein
MLIYWGKHNIINKNTEDLLDVRKNVGLEENTEKTNIH